MIAQYDNILASGEISKDLADNLKGMAENGAKHATYELTGNLEKAATYETKEKTYYDKVIGAMEKEPYDGGRYGRF